MTSATQSFGDTFARFPEPSPDSAAAAGIELPAQRTDVPVDRRERAAKLVLAISRLYAPDQLVDAIPAYVENLFDDDGVSYEGTLTARDEALQWVDLLLDVLVPRAATP